VRYLLKTRREIVYEASKGYKKLSKKEKTERLDNLVCFAIIKYIKLKKIIATSLLP